MKNLNRCWYSNRKTLNPLIRSTWQLWPRAKEKKIAPPRPTLEKALVTASGLGHPRDYVSSMEKLGIFPETAEKTMIENDSAVEEITRSTIAGKKVEERDCDSKQGLGCPGESLEKERAAKEENEAKERRQGSEEKAKARRQGSEKKAKERRQESFEASKR